MDNITLSEQLMQRGWWEDALKVIERADVQPADRTLQEAALTCRRECVAFLLALDLEDMTLAQIQAELQNRFDRYTVQWVLNDYIGVGSLVWQKAKGRTARRTNSGRARNRDLPGRSPPPQVFLWTHAGRSQREERNLQAAPGKRTDLDRKKNSPRQPFSFRTHDLRHTFCTMLYNSGVDVKTAAYLMGHADIRVTMAIYTHLSNEKRDESQALMLSYFDQLDAPKD